MCRRSVIQTSEVLETSEVFGKGEGRGGETETGHSKNQAQYDVPALGDSDFRSLGDFGSLRQR